MTVLDKGVSPSFLQQRSRRLFTFLEYNWIIFPLTFTAVFYSRWNLLGNDDHSYLGSLCFERR